MLKYIYSVTSDTLPFNSILQQKLITSEYNSKFYVRSYTHDDKEILILDDNLRFFLLNKQSIKKHFNFSKEKLFVGRSLQLKTFVYSKLNGIKLEYFINNKDNHNYTSYLKTLYFSKTILISRVLMYWPHIFIRKGRFRFLLNGVKGVILKRNYTIFKKYYKVFKKFLFTRQKFNLVLQNAKQLILKTLLLNLLKTNKILVSRSRYKNQYKNLITVFKQQQVNKKISYANIKATNKKGFK